MVKTQFGDEIINTPLRLRIRFDYRGDSKPKGLFFGNKDVYQVAEEMRDRKVSLLRNIPLQGIHIEDVDSTGEIYTIYDEIIGATVAYAPIQVTIRAESLEDVIKFIMREEFRKVELLEPDQIFLGKNEVEKLLFKINEELQSYCISLERRAER